MSTYVHWRGYIPLDPGDFPGELPDGWDLKTVNYRVRPDGAVQVQCTFVVAPAKTADILHAEPDNASSEPSPQYDYCGMSAAEQCQLEDG